MKTTYKINGTEAIRIAERDGVTLRCYANPIDNGGKVTVDKAREIAKEDAGLIYTIVEAHANAGDFDKDQARSFCAQWPEGPQPDND